MGYKTDFSKIDLDKYYFDEVAANRAVRYIETQIKHVKGKLSGKPMILEQWQKDEIIKPLFGWKHKETGLRKYTRTYIEIPKKNGKTALAGAVACIFLDIESEPGIVEIYSIAYGKDQAKLSWDATAGYILQSKRLSKKAEVFRNSIIVDKGKANARYFKPMSRDSKGQEGINPQLAIVDELHVHPDASLIENMEKSMASRLQPLSFVITTAGDNLYGVGYQRRQEAVDCVLGKADRENLLVCIHCADKEDDPFKEETWMKANPNYGVSVYKERLQEYAEAAKSTPANLNSFLRYHLNIWTAAKDAWIPDHTWMASTGLPKVDLRGRECYGGLDLSSRSDITAFTLVFPVDDRYYSLNWFWLPEDKGRYAPDASKNLEYLRWIEDKHIVETSGRTVDYAFIINKVSELSKIYDIRVIAYDNWNSSHIAPQLQEAGFDLFEFRQGYRSMSLPTKELEALVMDKRFEHFGNPVLRWMVGNAVIQSDPAGNIKVIKDVKRPSQKVDGVISNVMALGMCLNYQIEEKGSYMEDEKGLWFI